MVWKTPRTWTAGELVTALLLNEQLRDNLAALKDPPTKVVAGTGNRTTTATDWDAVDEQYYNHTITTSGGAVLIVLSGAVSSTAGTTACFDVMIDGVRQAFSANGLIYFTANAGQVVPFTMIHLAQNLAPGEHAFMPVWKTTTGTLVLQGGANQFWVREIS